MVRTSIAAYLVAAVIFGVLDSLWLTQVAAALYQPALGDLLAPSPVLPAALAFYLVYLGGITYFCTVPALLERSGRRAVVSGAALGFVAYSTWALTNLAVVAGFSAVALLDLLWGTCATAVTAALTYAVCRRLLSNEALGAD